VQTYDDYKGNTGHEWMGEEPDKVGDAVAADAAAADDTVAVVVAIVDGVAAAVAVAGVAVVAAAGVCGCCCGWCCGCCCRGCCGCGTCGIAWEKRLSVDCRISFCKTQIAQHMIAVVACTPLAVIAHFHVVRSHFATQLLVLASGYSSKNMWRGHAWGGKISGELLARFKYWSFGVNHQTQQNCANHYSPFGSWPSALVHQCRP
jgi:hypothetical protein